MDSTPAKRRKISHTSSPGLPNRSASTPSKPASRDGPQTTPRRASFRSPTKASLARFNPELVGRPQSASSADRRIKTRRDGGISSARRRLLSPPISRGSQSQAETAATTNFQRSTRSSIARSSLAPTDDSQLPGGPQEITPAPSLEETKNNNNNNNNENGPGSRVEEMTATQRLLQTPPRRRSRLNDRFEVVWSDLKTGPILEGAPIHARSTISARGPIRTPVGLRRQRKRNTTVEEDDEEEPDLPSTPSRSGNRSVTKVPGGLFSSPSLRSRKKEDKTSRGPSSLAREAPTTTSVHPEESESNVQPVDEEEDIPNVDDSLEAPPAQAGQEIRDQLLIELKDLQEEIKQLEKQVSAATITAQTHKHRVDLLPFSFNAFLPFSKPRLYNNNNNKSDAHIHAQSLPIPDHPPPSHHPIELDNPLPYLQAFTPLTFSSTYETISWPTTSTSTTTHSKTIGGINNNKNMGNNNNNNNKNINGRYQRYNIKITSPGHLLLSRITLVVDTTSHEIINLKIPLLSSWAEKELGQYIHRKAKDGRDVTSICWAMGRYWVLAKRRARCWMRCEREFSGLITSVSRGRLGHGGGDEDEYEDEIGNDNGGEKDELMGRKDLLRHLGHSSIIFRQGNQGNVELLVQWNITFDEWTGDVHSEISATAAVPGSWTQIDSRSSLSKIPKLFQTVMRDKGVLGATRIVVGLLFPGESL